MAAAVNEQPHRHLFRIAYVILAVGAALAAAAFAVFLADGGGSSRPSIPAKWGNFVPAGAPADEVHQIADFVGAEYRLPDGKQLVAVNPSTPPTVLANVPVANYAVSYNQDGQTNYTVIPAASSAEFQLCGLGDSCAIATGTPTPERARLLRREAVELALYTFHYVPSVQSVVTFMPPKLGEKPQYVFLFFRDTFESRASRPLTATLAEATPPAADAIPATEQATIDGLTANDLYRFHYTQGPDSGLWVVFDPPNIGG